MIGSSQLSSPKTTSGEWIFHTFLLRWCPYLCLFPPIARKASAQHQRSFCFNLSFLQITVEIKEEDRESFLELLHNATPACEVVSTVSAVKDRF